MALAYLGSLTIGECMPVVAGMQVALLADLQAQLAGQAALIAAIGLNPGSFTIAASLDFAIALVTAIEAQIALGIELPSISVQLAAAVAAAAALQVQVDALLALEFGTAGVHLYAFDGAANQLGGELSTALAGGFPGGAPTDHTNALVLATTVPAAWAALGKILKTS
jgi:hypothetical protein